MSTRINKAVAVGLGIGRRKADVLIAQGRVRCNGEVVTDLSLRVEPKDVLEADGVPLLDGGENRYWLYNKPRGVECTFGGEGANLNEWLEIDRGIRYGGRLDRNSEGLMLMSNDGNWLNRITHPSKKLEKEYRVTTDAQFSPPDSESIQDPEIGTVPVGQWELEDRSEQKKFWRVILAQGVNRQIRRVVASQNGTVHRLVRVRIGEFVLSGLNVGEAIEIDPENYIPEQGIKSTVGKKKSKKKRAVTSGSENREKVDAEAKKSKGWAVSKKKTARKGTKKHAKRKRG